MWIKIESKEKDILQSGFNEDNLEDAIVWLEKNWTDDKSLYIMMTTNEAADYFLVPKGKKFEKEGMEDGPIDFENKQEVIKNLKDSTTEGK